MEIQKKKMIYGVKGEVEGDKNGLQNEGLLITKARFENEKEKEKEMMVKIEKIEKSKRGVELWILFVIGREIQCMHD